MVTASKEPSGTSSSSPSCLRNSTFPPLAATFPREGEHLLDEIDA